MYQLDVESLGVNYKYYSGEGVMCLCEFHNDTHPSMFVNLVEGNFYCFACGVKGNIDKLLQYTNGTKKYIPYNLKVNSSDNDEWLNLLSLQSAVDDSYLLGRGFSNEVIEKWGLLSDEDRVIIPLKKFDETIGLKVRIKNSKKGIKYLTFGHQPTYMSNFDINIVDTGFNVIITEGLLGLMRYDMLRIKCITPLSVNRAIGLRKLIENFKFNYWICFDNDIAGLLGTAKLLYVTRAFDNIKAIREPFDVDDFDLTKIDFSTEVKSPEVYVGFIQDEFGNDVFIKSCKQYANFKKSYKE